MDDKLKELRRLQKKNGGFLLAAKVVDAARNETNPLHDEFNWDDAEAAHAHRIEVAERLIRRFKIEYRESSKEERTFQVRVAEFTQNPTLEKGYSRTLDLLAGMEREATLQQEFQRCYGHVQRLIGYLQIANLTQLGDLVEKTMSTVRSSLDRLPGAEAGD